MISRWHLAAVLALVGMILVPITALAVVTCPYGIVNDPYPGKCPRYTDTDQNGICDISETDPGPAPVTTVPTTVPVSPVSSLSGSGSGQLVQVDDDDDGEDDDPDDEDDEGSRNRMRNRNSQSSGDNPLPASDSQSIYVPMATPVPVTPVPTVVNPTAGPTTPPAAVSCPYGLVNDPYPGKCPRYVDANRDGFCDLSVPGTAVSATTPTVPVTPYPTIGNPTPVPTSTPVSCPYGIVNDPYPGKCPRYVDTNGDGFCDLSVLEAVLTAVPTIPVTVSGNAPNQTCAPVAAQAVSCPYGLMNDPYPGKCQAYRDANNDALCDLSQEPACGEVVLPATECPFGKVNDPYPGACAKYVDMNINGICDYSEDTGGETGSADTGGSGAVPPTGLVAAGMGAGCIVIGYSFGRGKK